MKVFPAKRVVMRITRKWETSPPWRCVEPIAEWVWLRSWCAKWSAKWSKCTIWKSVLWMSVNRTTLRTICITVCWDSSKGTVRILYGLGELMLMWNTTQMEKTALRWSKTLCL